MVEHVELAIRDGDKRWAKALRARQAKWKQEAIERLTGSISTPSSGQSMLSPGRSRKISAVKTGAPGNYR